MSSVALEPQAAQAATPADAVLAPPKRPRKEFVLLNVARGIAALTVVPIHVVIHLSGNDGWKGHYEFARGFVIPFFFALTGFVLVLSHRSELERGWFANDRAYLWQRLRVFSVKRVVRLYPIYWITTTGVLLAAFILPGAMRDAKFAPRYILQSYVAWPPDQTLPILPQGWTVPYIMKCYLLFALAYVVPMRRLRWYLVALYIGVFVNTLRHLGLLGDVGAHLNYLVDFVFHPFSWQFLWGIFAALLIQRRGVRAGSTALLVSALLMYAAVYTADQMRVLATYDIRMATFGLAVGVLVYALAQYEIGRTVKAPWFFSELGNASYTLYITHLPLVVLLSKILRRIFPSEAFLSSVPMVWLQVAICVAFAFAFHRWIEEPVTAVLSRRFLPQDTRRHA